ncbi:MAG: SPFH/Band 7/PHB domain protein [Wenzhouxiangella sp.]|nr:MAG: SPFH/Band 7/PHB domain protein [Wenzhouxiangella sp.]
MFEIIIFLVVLVLVFLATGVRIVQTSQAVVVERLGSYSRTLGAGINLIIPFVDKPRPINRQYFAVGAEGEAVRLNRTESKIDLRETVMDVPPRAMITQDNVTVSVNTAVYYQIIDPQSAVYQVENLVMAIEVLTNTTLRALVGKMELDKLFESREDINTELQLTLDEAGNKWGVKITRVEVQDIAIPREVEDAMRKQMVAERTRRAMIAEADGRRQSEILEAQGERQAAIERAEGEKQAAILRAQGEQNAINTIMASGGGQLQPKDVVGYLLGLNYLKTLPDIAKEGDRVFLPFETTAPMAGLGALAELAKDLKGRAGLG